MKTPNNLNKYMFNDDAASNHNAPADENNARVSTVSARLFSWSASLVGALALLGMAAPRPALAGSGRVNFDDHTLDLTVNFRFAPSATFVMDMQNAIIGDSQVLWDATEGQLRLGRVTLTCSPAAAGDADVWVYLENGRTQSAFSGLGVDGAHVDYCPSYDASGPVLAHELGHLALGLGDEYEDPTRCIGACIEEDGVAPTERNQCLMQQIPGFSWSELCTAGNHDLRRGLNKSCDELGISPPCGDPALCRYYDPVTGKVEACQQEQMNHRSCWEQLVANFPWMRAPVGLPEAAAPGGFIPPQFDNQCALADTVMLLLDDSWSMTFNTERDDGPVCAGPGDTTPGCTGPRIDFVKAAARAWLELARDSGVRAGLTTFNNGPDYRLPFQDVNTHSIYGANGFRDQLYFMTPEGSTGIGRALQQTIEAFDGDPLARNKAVLLITDGENTIGPEPVTVVPDLQRRDIRVFTVSTGGASDSATLHSLSGYTRGNPTDAHSATRLVNFFAQQWAGYRNLGLIEPLKPYVTDSKATNTVFRVEENTSNLTLVLAGDMANMAAFGVRAILSGPAGSGPSAFDSEVAAADMTVSKDTHFMIVKLRNLNSGTWSLRIMEAPGAASGQTGNLTILSDHPETELFASLDRHVVDNTSIPVELRVVPIYHTALHNLESLTAVLKRPDGHVTPLAIQADPRHGQAFYTGQITDMPLAGIYEVRVSMRTGSGTFNDPGEYSYRAQPPNTVPVPLLERQAVQTFFVPPRGTVQIQNPASVMVGSCMPTGMIVNFTVTATNTLSGQSVPVKCFPPSGSVFQPGTTMVYCQAGTNNIPDATSSFPVTVALPPLTIQKTVAGNQVILSWPCGTLQEADSLDGPWRDLVNVNNPYTITIRDTAMRFYRTRR